MPEHVLAVDDPQAFLGGLVDAVEGILSPAAAQSALTVVRRKSLTDHLVARRGSISSIRLVTRGYIMELTCAPGPRSPGSRYTTETRRVVRGIVVSRRI